MMGTSSEEAGIDFRYLTKASEQKQTGDSVNLNSMVLSEKKRVNFISEFFTNEQRDNSQGEILCESLPSS